jgi:predicted MPP superfamily phosphohydrolase
MSSKFKKALEQINKPIEEEAKRHEMEAAQSASNNINDVNSELSPSKSAEAAEEAIKSAAPAEEQILEEQATSSEETISDEEITSNEEAVAEEITPNDEAASADELANEEENSEATELNEMSEEQSEVEPISKKEQKKKAKEEKRKEKAEKKAAKKNKKNGSDENSESENDEAADGKEKKKKKLFGGKFALILILVIVVLIIAGGFANYHLNNQLRPTFYQVQSNKVVDNVRVVAIADMHLKEFGENNTKLVDKIESYHPDIIAIAGDMNIEDNPDYSAVINLCARLNAIAPVYYALGNHEIDAILFKDSQIYYDLKAAGINVLNNETKTAEVGLSQIDIIGLTQNPKEFYEYGKKFFDEAMSDDDNFKLVLNHYPENFEGTLDDYNIDLAICGNAHGGQVRLPFIGGLYSADQGLFPNLCDGYHEIGNSKVIITKGLGSSGIVPRINNAPEITIVDINWY